MDALGQGVGGQQEAPVQDGGVVAEPDLPRGCRRQELAQAYQKSEFAGQWPSRIPSPSMQGVIKTYDPATGEGLVVRDTDRTEYALAVDALEGSIFRTLRQGQRVVFDLDGDQRAIRLRSGAEPDLGMGNVQL